MDGLVKFKESLVGRYIPLAKREDSTSNEVRFPILRRGEERNSYRNTSDFTRSG